MRQQWNTSLLHPNKAFILVLSAVQQVVQVLQHSGVSEVRLRWGNTARSLSFLCYVLSSFYVFFIIVFITTVLFVISFSLHDLLCKLASHSYPPFQPFPRSPSLSYSGSPFSFLSRQGSTSYLWLLKCALRQAVNSKSPAAPPSPIKPEIHKLEEPKTSISKYFPSICCFSFTSFESRSLKRQLEWTIFLSLPSTAAKCFLYSITPCVKTRELWQNASTDFFVVSKLFSHCMQNVDIPLVTKKKNTDMI